MSKRLRLSVQPVFFQRTVSDNTQISAIRRRHVHKAGPRGSLSSQSWSRFPNDFLFSLSLCHYRVLWSQRCGTRQATSTENYNGYAIEAAPEVGPSLSNDVRTAPSEQLVGRSFRAVTDRCPRWTCWNGGDDLGLGLGSSGALARVPCDWHVKGAICELSQPLQSRPPSTMGLVRRSAEARLIRFLHTQAADLMRRVSRRLIYTVGGYSLSVGERPSRSPAALKVRVNRQFVCPGAPVAAPGLRPELVSLESSIGLLMGDL